MSRWKPPKPKSSPYITAEGYQTLESELKNLWDKRKHVVKAITAAAAEGDRSENAEYIYRKKELRGIDSRIHFLQKTFTLINHCLEKTRQSKVNLFWSLGDFRKRKWRRSRLSHCRSR